MQLDEEAIKLNAQLDDIRKQIAEKRLRNKSLQKDLSAALAGADRLDAPGKGQPTERVSYAKNMQRGDAFFKEKKYSEALKESLSAAQVDVSSPLAANNVGYCYFKLGKHDEAVEWFQKTVALARKALSRCLDLAPNARNAAELRERINRLD